MGVELAVGAAMAAIGAGATIYSSEQQRMASERQASDLEEASRRSLAIDAAKNQEQAARERRQQIREARIQRAMVDNMAAYSGQSSSSANIVGGQQATATAAQNVGAINSQLAFSTAATSAREDYVSAQYSLPSVSPFATLAGSVGGSMLNKGVGLMGMGMGSWLGKNMSTKDKGAA